MPKPCSITDCTRDTIARGFCGTHYNQWRARQPRLPCMANECDANAVTAGLCEKHYAALRRARGYKPPSRACSIEDCNRRVRGAHGLCHSHLRRLNLYGDPLHPAPSHADRLRAKIVRTTPSGCWEVEPTTGCKGYGQFAMDRKSMGTHRAAWILAHGPIPDGLWVLHHCDNPPCVNPAHLYLGDCHDNVRDRVVRGRNATGPKLSGITRGEQSPNAKLTDDAVRAMRLRHESGDITYAALGALFGVGRTVARGVVVGSGWKHVR